MKIARIEKVLHKIPEGHKQDTKHRERSCPESQNLLETKNINIEYRKGTYKPKKSTNLTATFAIMIWLLFGNRNAILQNL